MINPVSFCGTPAKTPVSQKRSTSVGTKIGAATGAAVGVANLVKNRGMLTQFIANALEAGAKKPAAYGSIAVGAAIGIGLLAGVGALIGKGVNAVVNHFRGPKEAAEEV